MKILFIGDGPRDAAAVPRLVEKFTGAAVEADFREWKSYQVKGGYPRKLQFAIRQAKDRQAAGVVATVDADADDAREKARKLNEGRQRDRETAPAIPTAIGEARPHLEAWLLDDPVAVRQALGLPNDHQVQNVRSVRDPKGHINELISTHAPDANYVECLETIARLLEPQRCVHGSETGFDAFEKDFQSEYRDLMRA